MSTASSISEAWLLQARRAYQDGEITNAIRLFRLAAEAPGASAAVFLELAEVLWANFDFADG